MILINDDRLVLNLTKGNGSGESKLKVYKNGDYITFYIENDYPPSSNKNSIISLDEIGFKEFMEGLQKIKF